MHMLEKHHVAMVPGDIFGQDFGQHVRISYGRDLDTQRAAADRLVEVLSER
jgi:aspartate/methionine/tyrosine aminotransferase